MSEKFACPNCRILLEVSSEQRGKQVRCPVCGLISVFGSPVSSGSQNEPGDEFRPVTEARSTQSAPPDERDRERPRIRPLKATPSEGAGDWEAVRPTPTNSRRAPDTPKPAADTFVIDEDQVAANQSKFDRNWKIGFVLSLLPVVGIASPFCICCAYLPIVPLLLGSLGIVFTSRSRRGPKELNYLLAGLAIAFALVYCAIYLISIL